MKHPLTRLQVSAVPPEGVHLVGDIGADDLDLPEEDRTSFRDLLRYRLHLSLVNDGLLARGEIEGRPRCRCDRCLVYFDHSLKLDELCYFFREIKDDQVDLTDCLRQDILLALPQRLLCRPDCLGLCPNCGQNLNARACVCESRPAANMAWSELDKLELSEPLE